MQKDSMVNRSQTMRSILMLPEIVIIVHRRNRNTFTNMWKLGLGESGKTACINGAASGCPD